MGAAGTGLHALALRPRRRRENLGKENSTSTGARVCRGHPQGPRASPSSSSQGTDSGCSGERGEAGGGDSGRPRVDRGSPAVILPGWYVLDGASCSKAPSPLPACHVTMTAQEGKDFNMDSYSASPGVANCDPRLLLSPTIFPNTLTLEMGKLRPKEVKKFLQSHCSK